MSPAGTVKSTIFAAAHRFEKRLIFQRCESPVWVEFASEGPNIISAGHHQRFSASCAMRFCSSLPRARCSNQIVALALMKLSSRHTRTMARA